ncbi:MAG TPA: hypothetical protein VFR84_09490 [Candidatus Angelobacter sp.]|nr:hypothetical protein [Candidatus Angelobacter sp.]
MQYKKIELVGILAHTSPGENARAEKFFYRKFFFEIVPAFFVNHPLLECCARGAMPFIVLALLARALILSGGT